jgi:hypothetical protein
LQCALASIVWWRLATFFVTDSWCRISQISRHCRWANRPDSLIMSQAWDVATIHNLEDASFGSGCGVGRLVENVPHVTFGDRWLWFTPALSSSPGHAPTQEERHFAEGKVATVGPTAAMIRVGGISM